MDIEAIDDCEQGQGAEEKPGDRDRIECAAGEGADQERLYEEGDQRIEQGRNDGVDGNEVEEQRTHHTCVEWDPGIDQEDEGDDSHREVDACDCRAGQGSKIGLELDRVIGHSADCAFSHPSAILA